MARLHMARLRIREAVLVRGHARMRDVVRAVRKRARHDNRAFDAPERQLARVEHSQGIHPVAIAALLPTKQINDRAFSDPRFSRGLRMRAKKLAKGHGIV
jgi:hypothetical protein